MEANQNELWPGNRVEVERVAINSNDQRYDLFVEGYFLFNRNATKAAIHAGYSEATAYSQGGRLLKRPEIAAKIAARAKELLMEYGVEETLREVARIALADPRQMFDGQGRLLMLPAMDENTARAISSVEFHKNGVLKTYKFWPKSVALDQLMRHHSLYKDKLEVGGNVTLISHIPRPDHAERDALRTAAPVVMEKRA